MKYLYPFECEKLKLSTLAELQYAVDGNRREGRRPSYGGPGTGGQGGDYPPVGGGYLSGCITPPLPRSSASVPPVSAVPGQPLTAQNFLVPPMHQAAAAALLHQHHLQQQQQMMPGIRPPLGNMIPVGPNTVPGQPQPPGGFNVEGFNAMAVAAAMAARVNCLGQLMQQHAAAVSGGVQNNNSLPPASRGNIGYVVLVEI